MLIRCNCPCHTMGGEHVRCAPCCEHAGQLHGDFIPEDDVNWPQLDESDPDALKKFAEELEERRKRLKEQ